MTSEIKTSIEISVSPQALWKLLSDLKSPSQYRYSIKQITFDGKKRKGLGAVRLTEFDSALLLREEVIEWQPPTKIAFDMQFLEGNSPPVRSLSRHFEILSTEQGSQLQSTCRYLPPDGLYGRLVDFAFLRFELRRSFEYTDLALKQRLESHF